MMEREPGQELARGGARAQPPGYVAAHARAELVVAPEEHAAFGRDGSRGRLADVVQERTEPERLPASEPVGERAGELARHPLALRAGPVRRRAGEARSTSARARRAPAPAPRRAPAPAFAPRPRARARRRGAASASCGADRR